MNAADLSPKTVAVVLVAIVGGFLLWKGSKVAGDAINAATDVAAGIVTGDNALTQNATDASGAPVSAYQGAGIVGTVGAATNAASGGTLASIGSWIGITTYDLFHPAPAADTTPSASQTATSWWGM